MYNMYPYPWGMQQAASQPSNTPVYSVYKIIPVYLGGKPGTERVVLYTSSNTGLKAKAEIQRYREDTGRWVVEYTKEAVGVPYFLVDSGYWEAERKNVVVLYYTIGSGGFLFYTVVGRNVGTLSEIVSRSEIFQGGVWFEGARLIEAEGLRQKVWTRKNRRLQLVPSKVPPIPGATVIEFSISNSGKVNISQTTYQVPAGSVIQLVRTDLNTISERVLFSNAPIFQYIPHRNAFRITGKGTVDFTIIPGGYDWDNAVKVTVEGV